MVDKEKVKDFYKQLDNIQDSGNFLNFEIAWLIKNFENYTDNDITDEIIEKVYDFLEYLDELFDEYVVNSMIKILNNEK